MHYDEGLKVGYKWYDAEKKTPLFPFGFGLSYTTFAYSGLKVKTGKTYCGEFHRQEHWKPRGCGNCAKCMRGFPSAAEEPPKRLVGFSKLQLAPGESKEVSVSIDHSYLSIFDEASEGWKLVPGEYTFMAGGSSSGFAADPEGRR